MAATREQVIYLDVEDEITSAASRIRAADAPRVAVVVPAGSRIATSRINFRLLAREAVAQGRRIAIVAPDAPSRALAASAGLPVFGSVGEYESAAAADEDVGSGESAGGGSASGSRRSRGADASAGDASAAGASAATATAAAATLTGRPEEGTILIPGEPDEGPSVGARPTAGRAATSARAAAPPVAERAIRRGRVMPRFLPLAAAIVVLALVAGGVAGYVLLPSATVVVTPQYEPVGPISFTIRADPATTSVDGAAGVIPAERLTFDLSATGTFPATGKREEKRAATGVVRWTNCDPTASYRIPAGAVVGTSTAIRFSTTEAVFLPVAGIKNGNVLDCQSGSVGVQAVDPGPEGNVDAGAIDLPPATYNANVIHVTNPDPTSGGSLKTFPKVKQADVDAAQSALQKQLGQDLDARIAEPGAVPSSMTAFPVTASISEPVLDADPAALVGEEIPTFDLTMTATGAVVAVDEGPIRAIGAARLASSVRQNRSLVDDSVTITTGKPSVSGVVVTFPVEASATQVATLDPGVLRDAIRGQTVEEARRTLAAYGRVSISTWPEWVSTIPTIDQRLDVEVGAPSPRPPSPSPRPTPSPSRPVASPGAPAASPSGS
jgi:hypothetical protein